MEQIEAKKFKIQLKLKDDFIEKDFDIYSDFNTENHMDLVDFYANSERIDKWKNKLIEKIKECKNPFNIKISWYSEKYKVPKNKVIKAPQKFINRTKNATADKIYYVREDSYNYHKRLDDHYYTYYILYDKNKLSKISYNEFYKILEKYGYNGYDGMKQWEKDYPDNFMIVDTDMNDDFKINDIKTLKQFLKIYD